MKRLLATLTLLLALAAPGFAAVVDPGETTPGEPPEPPPPPAKKKVYLTGSRFSSAPSVRSYLGNYTAGRQVAQLLDRASQSQRDAWYAFVEKMTSWPSSADVYRQTHVGGTTYVVDEEGNILGTLSTFSIFQNGLPGMNYLGNPWGNGDYNKVFIGPGQLSLNGQEYEVVAFVSVSPIIIDLDDSGQPAVDRGEWQPHATRFNLQRARLFDINGDGDPDLTEWLGPEDGLLVAPIEEVRVLGGNQLFGTAVGFVDGYQKLGLLRDKDGDGYVRGGELQGLQVWVDADQDALCQPDELRSVQELGITSISTSHNAFKSTCIRNGKRTLTWDWWPTVMMVRPAAQR
ncbi:MAG TPA: hypothetical protein VNO81_04055 [Candidatus Nitrosotenuis sp.]|nr:hypothetical protein [Candidatus Nitrosotenuis sp.]